MKQASRLVRKHAAQWNIQEISPSRAAQTSSIAKRTQSSVTGDRNQQGVYYGQRKQQSEKRSQKAKKGKAEACSSCLPPGVLAGRVVTSPAILCR